MDSSQWLITRLPKHTKHVENAAYDGASSFMVVFSVGAN